MYTGTEIDTDTDTDTDTNMQTCIHTHAVCLCACASVCVHIHVHVVELRNSEIPVYSCVRYSMIQQMEVKKRRLRGEEGHTYAHAYIRA